MAPNTNATALLAASILGLAAFPSPAVRERAGYGSHRAFVRETQTFRTKAGGRMQCYGVKKERNRKGK